MLKRFNQVAELLSLSRNGLHKLMAKDDAFPIPIRMGESRQSHLFFDVNELEKWLENKKRNALKIRILRRYQHEKCIPEFLKAINHYRSIFNLFGESAEALEAFNKAFDIAPDWFKDEYAIALNGESHE